MTTKPTIDLLPLSPRPMREAHDDLDPLDDVDAPGETADGDDEPGLIELVREHLGIGNELSDVTIAASLAAVAARSDNRGRWLAAFGSPLGRWLASRGSDLNTALNVVLGLAPRPLN